VLVEVMEDTTLSRYMDGLYALSGMVHGLASLAGVLTQGGEQRVKIQQFRVAKGARTTLKSAFADAPTWGIRASGRMEKQ
jgi:hypothetical protein